MVQPPAEASPLTQADLETGLRQLGVRAGTVLEVHSSLSSLGLVSGGAATVIAALMSVLGSDGTLVMSAYPVSPAIPLTAEEEARGLTWKVRLLPPSSTERTGMGRIADVFSHRPNVVCGIGLHRVCAWGKDAARYSEGYQQLLADDGSVLLIGVGIDRCSSMHQAERQGLPPEVTRLLEPPADLRRDYPADQWGIGYGSVPNDAWGAIWREADALGLIRRHIIGRAECCLFKARDLVDRYAERLRTDPYTLFGVEPDHAANP